MGLVLSQLNNFIERTNGNKGSVENKSAKLGNELDITTECLGNELDITTECLKTPTVCLGNELEIPTVSFENKSMIPMIAEEFEVKNGIAAEILKNVGKKLMCDFLNHEKIRSLVGSCQEMYEHIKQSRTEFIPAPVNDLTVQSKEDVVLGIKAIRIIKCSNYTGWTWAFLDRILENNSFVYQMNFKCVSLHFDMAMGVIAVEDDLSYGNTKNPANYCMYHNHGEVMQNGDSDGNNVWRENDIVGVEVNTLQNTLRFFVNGQLQPVSYSGLPARLRYCVAEECSAVDSYRTDSPLFKCARYMHTMHVDRMASWGDEIELVSFRRFVSQPSLRLPPADICDPDHFGYQPRVVEWNYLKKQRR